MSALACPPPPAVPGRALAVSIALHAAAVLLLPGLAKEAEEVLPPLVATLRFLPAAAPEIEAAMALPPQRVAPTPATPKRLLRAEPAAPLPARVSDEVPPVQEAPATPAAAGNVARSDSPPPPAAPVAAAPAPAPDASALDDYGRALSDLLARQQQYPRVAAMRGWEGEVRLRLKVARKGNLVAVQVVTSSGHEILDRHAVQMVQDAALPRPPANFGDGEIQVVVPIQYKLQKPT